jgi:hypothetical protein
MASPQKVSTLGAALGSHDLVTRGRKADIGRQTIGDATGDRKAQGKSNTGLKMQFKP